MKHTIHWLPESEAELRVEGKISPAGARILGQISTSILDYENERLQPGGDIEKIREWLVFSKRRIEEEVERFGITVIVQARTMPDTDGVMRTSFCVKFRRPLKVKA